MRGYLLIIGAVLIAIVLILVIGVCIWPARSTRLVDEELAKIHEHSGPSDHTDDPDRLVDEELAKICEAGEPVTAKDMDAFYQTPEKSKDCTDLWLNATAVFDGDEYGTACGELPIVGKGEAEIPPLGDPWPDQAAVGALLDKYAESMKLMHEAARRGGAARYPIDFDAGLVADWSHCMRLRPGARMLALEAHVRVRQGDAHAAAESIRTMLRLAESLEREPNMVSQLVRMVCHGIASSLVVELLTDAGFSEEDLARLQEDFAAVSYDDGVQAAMIGERALGIQVFQDPAKAFEALGDERLRDQLPCNDDFLLYIDLMSEIVAAAKLDDPERLRAAEQWEDRYEAIFDDVGAVTKNRYLFTSLLTPAMSVMFQATSRHGAVNRSTVTWIALERYRRKHGALPEKLEQLVPEFLDEVPADPFDGRPLRYLIRDGKPVIYSVGKNRVDDGGQGDYTFEPDILFPIPPREDEE
jgi:hypothetical protein